MTAVASHAECFLLGLDISEDPWAERPAVQTQENAFATAGLHCAAGLWGVFLATAIWWSYALVTATQPVATIAQAN